MTNRKLVKSGERIDTQVLENCRSAGKAHISNDYLNRRVFTETVDQEDEFEIEKAMKNFGFNFAKTKPALHTKMSNNNNHNNNNILISRKHLPEKKQMLSGSKDKNHHHHPPQSALLQTNYNNHASNPTFKVPKTNNLVISTNNIHQNINIYTEDLPKKRDSASKVLLTEGAISGKVSGSALINAKSKQKLLKKDSAMKKTTHIISSNFAGVAERSTLKKEKRSNKEELRLNKSKDMGKSTVELGSKERNLKTQADETEYGNMRNSTSDIEIVEKIGQGTFGEVYKAILGGNRVVAIKKVFQDKKYKNRELEILNMLDNDFVLRVLFTFYTVQKGKKGEEDKEYLNVVMEYFEHNLYQVATQFKRPLPEIDIKIYMYQLFRGLTYIHSLDICHRDIKPPNILVNKKNYRLIICDFGSAKRLVKGEPNLAYICSRCYRAPQLIFGSVGYTTMIDIWSAGCVLLELLKGEPFFVGDNNIDQLVEIIKVLGTPSKTEVVNMNPNYDLDDYKFPKIKAKDWKNTFPKADEKLISFIKQIMIYSPKERLNAAEALAHEYFDELREESRYRELIMKKNIPCLFQFTKDELAGNQHLIPKLIPSWFKGRSYNNNSK